MHRRDLLRLSCAPLVGLSLPGWADAEPKMHRLAAGWRTNDAGSEGADRVGIIEVDWSAAEVRIVADLPATGRAHGVVALPDGGFVAVATRPGRWLMRCDAAGRVIARAAGTDEQPARSFNGHVTLSSDGQWLFTTETGRPGGTSWISVRDARTLKRKAQFTSAGFDAHHCLLDDQGLLLVANGGILRAEDGRKVELDRMQPSLVQIDPQTAEVIGRWRLDDQRLSVRHLAWSKTGDKPVLGIGLQAEHDDPAQRKEAPALALWSGGELRIPTRDAQAAGYVGDIAAGPADGFLVSGQKVSRALWWHPRAPQSLTRFAELTEACALAALDTSAGSAALVASARGVAYWHPAQKGRMLAWPRPMLPDNHWALLAG